MPVSRLSHTAYARSGDLGAIVELRQRFPGITNNTAALDVVRMVLTMRPDDGTIAARIAALKAERRRPKPSAPKVEPLVIWRPGD